MATTYYVDPVNGSNSNNGKSAGAAFLTFAKAGGLVVRDDWVIVLDGTFTEKLTCKSGVTYMAQNKHGVIIDCAPGQIYGGISMTDCDNVTVNGFWVKNNTRADTAGIGGKNCHHIWVTDNIVENCKDNGIALNRGEFLYIEGNETFGNGQYQARSGISVLSCETIANDTTTTGPRVIIRGNISHDNITTSGSHADGDGIIVDRFDTADDDRDTDNSPNYPYPWLVEGNLCFGNGGAGIRVTYCSNGTVRKNTCYGNGQDTTLTNSSWCAELHSTHTKETVWEDNIGHTVRPTSNGFSNNMANADPVKTLTVRKNIFWKSGSGRATYQTPTPAPAIGSDNLTVDPKLVNPVTTSGRDGNGRLKPVTSTILAGFQTASDSPARGAARTGGDIGWWQSSGTPTSITVATRPTITLGTAGAVSGASYTYANGTYSGGTPTFGTPRLKAQLWVNGKWDADSVTTALGTFPTVDVDTKFRIKEDWYDSDNVKQVNGSLEITLRAPTTQTLTPPTCTVAPAIPSGAPVVGTAVTCSDGTWAGNPTPTLDATTPRQWYRCLLSSPFTATALSGANGASYTPVSGDVGYGLRCDVKKTNSQGSLVAASNITVAVVSSVTDYTLSQLTTLVNTMMGQISTLQTNDTAKDTRIDGIETAYKAVDAAQTTRIGTLETDASTLRGRVTDVEDQARNTSEALDGVQNVLNDQGGRLSGVEADAIALGTRASTLEARTTSLEARTAAIESHGGGGGSGGVGGGITSRELQTSLNMIEAGNNREAGRVLRAILSGQTSVVTGTAGVPVSGLVAALASLAADPSAGPQLGTALALAVQSMPAENRSAFLAGWAATLVGNGEAWHTNSEGSGIVGRARTLASQGDILAASDTNKAVTAASVGGLLLQRSIPYAATETVDFSGQTPVWSFENLISCTGAVALQAAMFPAYMVGKEFSVRFVRASGTGNVTIQDMSGGAAKEYRTGLSVADLPALGTTAGDSLTVRGKVMSTSLWRIEAFEWKTA